MSKEYKVIRLSENWTSEKLREKVEEKLNETIPKWMGICFYQLFGKHLLSHDYSFQVNLIVI